VWEEARPEALLKEEWTKSSSMQATITKLVRMGILPEATIGGWQPSSERYPRPRDGELVVFEDFYLRGFGTPVHPFLRKLLNFYKISLCNLHPNSILAVSIFINFCEAYLGIYPHFNLWWHFYCLKRKGGSGGSEIAGGAYIVLRNNMRAQYLNLPLNNSIRDWYKKWFYVQQEVGDTLTPCDIGQIPEQQDSWSEVPHTAEMVQVRELLELIDRRRIDGPYVAANYIFRRVQPCKERVHPMFEYTGGADPTREMLEVMPREELDRRLALVFDMRGYLIPNDAPRAFQLSSLPPQV
jgi:hypothetical protein